MISQCPKCHQRLTDFAVSCEKCGWSIINTSAPQSATSKPKSKRGTAKTITIDPESKKSAPKSVPSRENEPPVVIVRQVAKTAPPPPPEDKSTEDIPPAVRETNGMATVTDLPPLEIDLQIQRAMDYIEQENYTSALNFLNRAIIDIPADRLAECFSLRGYVHLKNLDFVKAENDCTQAINQNWEEAQTYAWRAAARGEQNKWRKTFDDLEKACELAGAQRDQYLSLMDSYSETASEYYREQIKNGNETADLFFERGWIYFRSGKYNKAERDFNHALALEPDHAWASVGLAKLRFPKLKRVDPAAQEVRDLCNTATHGDAACERSALEIRAQLNHREEKYSSAQRDLDRLFELANGDSKRLVDCCWLRSQLGDHVQAIEGLTSVLEANSDQHLATLVRGDCYRAIKNYSLAIADYKRFLRFYPEDGKALTRRAEMYLATGRYNLAHVDLEEAIQTDKTNFDAYLIRARVHLKEEQLDQALTACETAVRLDNQQPEAFAVLAEIYQKLCDYSRSIEEYSRSIELAPIDHEKAQYLYHRGVAYYEMEEFEKALKDFKKSSKLRPNHSGSWIWKAAACSRMEKWSDAILGLQQAIAIRPSAAQQYLKLGQPAAERAIVHFDREIQRGNDKPDTFRQRGLAYQFLAKESEAIRDYTVVLNNEPDDVETLIRRGQALAKRKKHASAIEDFTRVIRKDESNHSARYCRAISRAATGKLTEARSDIVKAIKAASHHPRYHILLAELHQKSGEIAKVIESYDRAILQDPSDPMTYRRRGATHVQAQSYVRAISDFTHSLELMPNQVELLVQRGNAYLKANQLGPALEDFELALTHNDKLAKAYSGRAAVLVLQDRHEYSLIWLTKGIHRFTKPRELAEIVFARGKTFFQMGRLAPATSDFSVVIDLMRSDAKFTIAARYARAIANVHSERWDKAARDFKKILKLSPNDNSIKSAIAWLANRKTERPKFLSDIRQFRRPTRPPVIRRGVKLIESVGKLESSPPHDTWVVRNVDKKEYGPIHSGILKTWILDGRVDVGMKLLRADWSKWKRAEKIFSEISPVESQPIPEDFPGIDINRNRANSNGDA
jgi:tetratricopeptide (TPR) repeat protein